jgi:hypothetical protein
MSKTGGGVRGARLARFLALALPALIGLQAGIIHGAGDRWLIKIDATDDSLPGNLVAAGFHPVHLEPTFILALATPEEEADSRLSDLHPIRLSLWDTTATFSVVYLPGARHAGASLNGLGQVLFADDRIAVVKTPSAEENRLFESYPTARISGSTVVPAETGGAWGKTEPILPVAPEPAILAMIDAVDGQRLQSRVRDLQNMVTRRSDSPGGGAAQNYLIQQFTAMGYTDIRTQDYRSTYCRNVIVVKPGLVTPERIYVIGGHYDSISHEADAPGADDNASGTVGVLEAAQILSPYSFESTIYFIGFSGEEQGLVGSDAWCDWAKGQGLGIRGYLNLDMEGYLEGGRDLDIIFNGSSAWLRQTLGQAAALYVPDLPVVDGHLTGGSSDHYPFWSHGYCAIFLFEDSDNYSPYIHTRYDTIGASLNDFSFMRENIQVALATLATLAVPVPIAIDHTPLPDTWNLRTYYSVPVRVRSVAPVQADSLRLCHWIKRGPTRWSPLWETAQSDQFLGYIPAYGVGTEVSYYLRVRDMQGHVQTSPIGAPDLHYSFVVGLSSALVDDFESDRGWTVGAPGDAADSGIWVRADPIGTDCQPENDHSLEPGHLCFVTGNGTPGGPVGEQDADGGRTTLLSPVFNLDGAAYVWLTYWRWFVDAGSADDTLLVSVSNDGGSTWTLLERVTESRNAWVGASIPDLRRILPLTAQMRIKFVLEDQGNGSLLEAALDDVGVRAHFATGAGAADPVASGAPLPEPAARLYPARPNPAYGSIDLRFNLASPGRADLRVFDPGGRMVRSLVTGVLPSGDGSCRWDGCDEAGRAVPGGVYFVRLRMDETTDQGRVILLK